jgi:hypothetical protein
MTTRYVTFIIRMRFDEGRHSLPGSSGVQGTLQQAGSTQTQPFDTLDRLVDLLRKAIAGIAPKEPDAPRETG